MIREDHVVEDALLVKSQQDKNYKRNIQTNNQISTNSYNKEKDIVTIKERMKRKIFHLVSIVAKWDTLHLNVERDLMLYVSSTIKWDIK